MGCGGSKEANEEAQTDDGGKPVQVKMKESDWIIHKTLGKGAFGTVRAAELKNDRGVLYALKYMNKAYVIEQNMVEKVIAEKEIMKQVNHPFICKLHYAFQNPTDVIMALSLLTGGDLQYHLDSAKKLNEMGVRFYLAQILHALCYLHELGIVHRDMKPGNILLDSKGNSYITDFGISASIKPGQYLKSNCGTLHYMPPEVYRNEPYNFGMDMWAVGVIMYEMLYWQVPFDGNSEKELMSNVCSKQPKFVHKIDPKDKGTEEREKYSQNCIDLVTRLLDKNKNTRITAAQAKDHPFFALLDWNQVLQKAYLPPFTPAKDGGVVSSIEMQEVMNNGTESSRTIPDEKQVLFRNWDYNPLPGEDNNRGLNPALQKSASKPNMPIAAAPASDGTGDDDDEDDEEGGGISRAKYKAMQEQQRLEKEAARQAEAERKAQLRANIDPSDSPSTSRIVRPNQKTEKPIDPPAE